MELNWRERRCVEMLVTKIIADAWLAYHNKHNRDLKHAVVEGYARDLQDGRFELTHQGIAFDWEGQLIDGQHRLEAISRTGFGATFFVTTGLPPKVRALVDTHSKRSVADAFTLSGRAGRLGGRSGHTAAGMWARMLWGNRLVKGKETRQQLLEFSDRYADAGEWALTEFAQHPKARFIEIAPVLAAVARAYYHYTTEEDRQRLARFVEVLCSGIPKAPHDATALHWRNALLSGRVRGNSNVAGDIYGKTCRAIQWFMRGDTLTRFYTPEEDLFPLPPRTGPAQPTLVDRVAPNPGQLSPRGSHATAMAARPSH